VFRVTRRYQFSASHRLHAPSLGEAENRELYGKCNHRFGHGHNYVVEISVRGPAEEATGRAVDPQALDRLVRERVLSAFDHRDLNAEVEAFREMVPTSENLAIEVGRRLQLGWSSTFPGGWPRLEKIRIAETDRNIFEIRCDEIE
jgi:6-pyruvoyltetrahydropterin/6-carboxytetrahydropterin synthase